MLNIQDNAAIKVLTDYAAFNKEYDEMTFQCKQFVNTELDKIINANDEESKVLAMVEFKSNVYPPLNYVDSTLKLITEFLIKNAAPGIEKTLSLRKVFYIYKLLKHNAVIASDKSIIDGINYIFSNVKFEVLENDVKFEKLSSSVADVLNNYNSTYERFKEVVDNVDTNIEIEDSLVAALMELSLIRLIVDSEKLDDKE